MKKRCIAILLFWVLLVSFLLPFREKAHADALTASMIAGGAFAIGQTFGITFSNDAWNSVGTMNMMEGEVSAYCGSRSLAEVFGSETIRAVAGKLVVGQTAYNAIVNFLNYLNVKYNLGQNRVGLGFMFNDDYAKMSTDGSAYLNGWSLELTTSSGYWMRKWYGPDGKTSTTGYNDVTVNQYPNSEGPYYSVVSGGISGTYIFSDNKGATRTRSDTLSWSKIYPDAADRPKQVYATSTGDISSATVLNPGYGWAGTVPGYDDPDTNLDQILDGIFEGVADTNLDVTGEVIPLDPPQPVETWVPVDDVIDGINQGGEVITDIGDDIGNISGHLDDIGDQIGDVTGAIEGVQEGIQTQTGVISGAMDQAAQDVVDAIGEQTATLDQTLTATAEGVQDIAEALQPAQIDPKKFDLRGLFPFCIPFDIHNLLQKFNAEPVAPHVQLPFVIESIGFSYMIDLDFSAFDPVAAALRTVEFIVFAIGLAWATSKVIKW